MYRRPSFKKPWTVCSIVLLSLTASCRHAGLQRVPAGRLAQNEEILIETGDSAQATYSPLGDRLVFVSGKRPGHNQTQVYVKEPSGVEHRVTFSNGTVQHPRFHPREPLIVYASSTDELKEYPPLLNVPVVPGKRPPALGMPMEIYVHGLNSYDIERITTHAGFDGQARFGGEGRFVTWTQSFGDRTRVQSVNRLTHVVKTVPGLGLNPAEYLVAPDESAVAWLEYDKDFTTPRLMVRREKKAVEIAADRASVKADLSFSSDSRWLFWSELDPTTQTYALVSFELEGSCVRPIPFTEKGSRRDPVLSPNTRWLTYTLIGADKSRVARSPFNTRPGPCAPPP